MTSRFLFYLVGDGRWEVEGVQLFLFFKSFDNNMVYTLGTDVYVYKRNRCRTKVLWVLKFGEVGDLGL